MRSNTASHTEFQSTLPREERHIAPTVPPVGIYFNPRSHERSDFSTTCNHSPPLYFNPRSHERSDKFKAPKILGFEFQSTLPREERLATQKLPLPHRYFNPRSHERSDVASFSFFISLPYFNPRSHERSDSNIAQKICLFLYNTDNKYIIR